MKRTRLRLMAGLISRPAIFFALSVNLTVSESAVSAGAEKLEALPRCTTQGAEMTDKVVVAQVVLRAADGSSILESDEPMTAELVERYKINDDRLRVAREKLSGHGFDVMAAGPFSLSIRGDKRKFEEVFGTRLQERQIEPAQPGATDDLKTFFEPQAPVEVPADLAPFVATVTFPTPPELFP